ncbi:natriuretic peptide A-like [Pleuronectes platessa]|uniref:natriuretic peptide A-like n=1 Tax=Pleuronectes platessa TaxID=8262 RepID=UPI00232A6C26|nr:natriuretic peptide A-like [Pleuronectes platessa]
MQKKSNPSVSVYCFSLLLLINLVGAKSNFDIQSLKRILEEKLNTAPYYYSEEMATDGNKSEIIGRAPEKHPPEYWEPDKQSILAHLFKDLMRTSKRSSSRYKKGGLRSCFGVRLERIGSFSGLGC